jgi:hypothetical protein
LQSIRNNRTRNFYTGQFFNPDSDTSDNFSWTYDPDNLEEELWYKKFHIPFEVTKNSKLKYDSNEQEEPDRKSPRPVFKPYKRATSFVYGAKTIGGIKRRASKKKTTSKKKKTRCIKKSK